MVNYCELVIVDNADNLQREALLDLKQLFEESGVPIVLVGGQEVDSKLDCFGLLTCFPTLFKFEKLDEMLPPKGVTMKPRPILLCAVCYAENPYHRIEWQFKERWGCNRHQLPLLGKCINCETPFPIPALWVQGECPHCFLPFARMAKRQKSRRA